MKNYCLILILCFCYIISGCAASGSNTDIANATLENPLQVPLIGDSPTFHIKKQNNTQAREDIPGLLIALLQSEYNMRIADNADSADYIIELTIESFGQTGSVSAPTSTGEVALPALAGAVAGAQIGASVDGGDGALWGAGIGAAAGAGLGLLTSGGTHYVWQMIVDIDIKDKQDEIFTSRINAKAQGEKMDALEAAQALENEVAWTVVKAFKKSNQ